MKNGIWLALALLSALAYTYLGYGIERANFAEVLVCFAVPFSAYFLLLIWRKKRPSFQYLIYTAIGFRLIFLFALPSLSDDYFRFLWDGQLFANGLNPFDFKPEEVENLIPQKQALLEGMNSPQYYSIYPPIAQYIYAFAAWLFPHSLLGGVVVMRLFILAAEIGTLYLLPKVLQQFFMNREKTLIYALNPLVIIELSGNLHFEAIVIFFLLLAIRFLQKDDTVFGGLSWALAAATKLIPLIFLPVFLRTWKWPKPFWFYAFGGFAFLLLWFPFQSFGFWEHFRSSVDLYFSTFEFNAGLYYLIREVWQSAVGYNPIQTLGPMLSKVSLVGVLVILWRRKWPNLKAIFTPILMALLLYYSLALIVHPWYICTLVFLSLFTKYTFPVLWSVLVVLSYATYQTEAYQENHYLVAVEYLLLFGWIGVELLRHYQRRLPWLRLY
ncbi:MAG: glycosyltransferase 87 family protein [Vicingaceae bacterium]